MDTVLIDQRQAPDDFSDAGSIWEDLGSFTITGSTLTVELSDNANGYVIADAIRISSAVVAGLTLTIDQSTISENSGSSSATVTRDSGTTGALLVSLSSDDTSEATVPSTVTIADGSVSATFTITAVDDALVDGTQTVTITASAASHLNGTDTIDVTDDEVLTSPPIIDNGDPGYSHTGGWATNSGVGHDGDLAYTASGSGSELATWSFSGLSPGSYSVSATWYQHSNRASNAPCTILDGSTALGTVLIDQRPAPDDFSDAGSMSEDLGRFT
ncbi:MAG: hypothetical protein GY700_01965, partial [Propionibacteriaceae bacterium]|nr:hypothetical protein [Propionibacteriaceae bacterium]